MPELSIRVDAVKVVPFAATPTLAFELHLENPDARETIHSVVLRAQIMIDVTRRRYSPDEQIKLRDLFGDPGVWAHSLRTMLWTHASVVIPAFAGETHADLLVPCTFDFNVAATKYFYGLNDGDVPLTLLFSGIVFYANDAGLLQVAPVSWDTESASRLPVQVWRRLIDEYYPNLAWVTLRRDTFDRLYAIKVRRGLPTWEQVLDEFMTADSEAPA